MSKIANINAYLRECGKSGADLSRAIGLSNATYSQWNTGKHDVSNQNLVKIAAYFTAQLGRIVTVNDLLDDKKAPIEQLPSDRELYMLDLLRKIPDKDKDHLISFLEGVVNK